MCARQWFEAYYGPLQDHRLDGHGFWHDASIVPLQRGHFDRQYGQYMDDDVALLAADGALPFLPFAPKRGSKTLRNGDARRALGEV
jgi:hypothetical protein